MGDGAKRNDSCDSKEGEHTRISLAFNCFLQGTLGSSCDLTDLRLPIINNPSND
jgi:hypothetical protein